MMLWGVLSSVVLAFLLILASSLAETGGILAAALYVFFGWPVALGMAFLAWGLGGLLFAMPLWTGLIACGLRAGRLRRAMMLLGAIAAGGLWSCFFIVAWGPNTPLLLATAVAGALTGALGGYGFCRSAMRS